MRPEVGRIREIVGRAHRNGRRVLYEHEGMEMLDALGMATPQRLLVPGSEQAGIAGVERLPGDRIVVKVVSAAILHKSDVGGIAIVPKDVEQVRSAIRAMERRFETRPVAGFLLSEFVSYDRSLGGELLFGVHRTADFGPVVTFGPGGVYTEYLSERFLPDHGAVILSPHRASSDSILASLQRSVVTPLITGGIRGQQPRIGIDRLRNTVDLFLDLASQSVELGIGEFEINPLVLTDNGPVALDVVVKLQAPPESGRPPRPIRRIRNLLHPRSIAVIGVSDRLNPGHVILNNTIREGFDRGRIYIVKPGREEFEGCRCVPDLESLPETVDLLIVAVDAAQVPAAVESVVTGRKAESVIVIPGGLGETEGSGSLAGRMTAAIDASRRTDWQGPVVNGGNCLGIRSAPGRYDTLFIPEYKLAAPVGDPDPVAVLSQSGAFAIAQASKMTGIHPRYLITMGNQADLTVGDYLAYLGNDDSLRLFACYVEGFRPEDGARWLEAASEIVASGRTVVLYRAGRTTAGAKASASHTASIAGDYEVTRQLAESAGVVVAKSLADFHDLIRLFCLLEGKGVGGNRIGALSNAGFECVAIADNLGPFELSPFSEETTVKLRKTIRRARLEGIVDVHNPIDVTPIMGDGLYAEAAAAVLDDDAVDIGIIGCVPLTPALQTLAPAPDHREDVGGEASIASRLIELHRRSTKPWVAVVDSGAPYDPMANHLTAHGVPTFRTADRALRLLAQFWTARRTET